MPNRRNGWAFSFYDYRPMSFFTLMGLSAILFHSFVSICHFFSSLQPDCENLSFIFML